MELSKEDLELLNSKQGLKQLLSKKKLDVNQVLHILHYETKMRELQSELVRLQSWVIENHKKVVVIFQGRDAAGKSGAIRRITAHINPRHYRIAALPRPSEEESGQWYFQRYIGRLPKPGEIVFFDRSWYNRAIVEPVNGFCTPEQYALFMEQVNDFEKMVVQSKCYLIKFYFSISKEEQAKRFADIRSNPLKRWKMSPLDERAQELWDEYTKYKDKMFDQTNSPHAPWKVIEANIKTSARIESAEHILNSIPYKEPV
jgi:polyphosphate kinase 2